MRLYRPPPRRLAKARSSSLRAPSQHHGVHRITEKKTTEQRTRKGGDATHAHTSDGAEVTLENNAPTSSATLNKTEAAHSLADPVLASIQSDLNDMTITVSDVQSTLVQLASQIESQPEKPASKSSIFSIDTTSKVILATIAILGVLGITSFPSWLDTRVGNSLRPHIDKINESLDSKTGKFEETLRSESMTINNKLDSGLAEFNKSLDSQFLRIENTLLSQSEQIDIKLQSKTIQIDSSLKDLNRKLGSVDPILEGIRALQDDARDDVSQMRKDVDEFLIEGRKKIEAMRETLSAREISTLLREDPSQLDQITDQIQVTLTSKAGRSLGEDDIGLLDDVTFIVTELSAQGYRAHVDELDDSWRESARTYEPLVRRFLQHYGLLAIGADEDRIKYNDRFAHYENVSIENGFEATSLQYRMVSHTLDKDEKAAYLIVYDNFTQLIARAYEDDAVAVDFLEPFGLDNGTLVIDAGSESSKIALENLRKFRQRYPAKMDELFEIVKTRPKSTNADPGDKP